MRSVYSICRRYLIRENLNYTMTNAEMTQQFNVIQYECDNLLSSTALDLLVFFLLIVFIIFVLINLVISIRSVYFHRVRNCICGRNCFAGKFQKLKFSQKLPKVVLADFFVDILELL